MLQSETWTRYSHHGRRIGIVSSVALLLVLAAVPLQAGEWTFRVRYTADVHPQPYTGRVYIFFSKKREQPRIGPNWFRPELFVAKDVVEWKPDEAITFSSLDRETLLAYPQPIDDWNLDGYRAQAVVRFNPHHRQIGRGPGNGYSAAISINQSVSSSIDAELVVDQVVEQREFPENRWVKQIAVPSRKLSKFHGREIVQRAAVILPASYYVNPERRYPTIFLIPGFGGTHFRALRLKPDQANEPDGVEFLRVVLDPSCPLGHHVFADSDNNGPVGTALVTEFLPEFDRQFRSITTPAARFLTGHSSGGWSSLWLQITYPDQFGGTWSTAPDSVDFRDFQRINLYQPGENMYVDAAGTPRPIARNGQQVLLWYRNFSEMEWVLGPGGQLHSFEAVFSPRDRDGKPELIWDRETGVINTQLANLWREYDIRLILERNWKTLGPKLQGKIHVFMGDADTFYLEGATRLLKESLEKLGSDAVVEIHTGRDHTNVMSPQLRARIRREMVDTFQRNIVPQTD